MVMLAGSTKEPQEQELEGDVKTSRPSSPAGADRQTILMIFLLSGVAGLVYEVVWARQLVLVFGNTTQAISVILTGFFGGMALGSVLGGRIADRVRSPLKMYAILELLVVVAVLATQVTFGGIHEVYGGVYRALQEDPTKLALVRFGLALLALGPATVLMGATLPTLSRQLVQDYTKLGHEFGELYLVNTVGAIYGAVLSGLVLIELIGLRETLLFGTGCSAAAGVAALLLDRKIARRAAPAPVTEITPGLTKAAAVEGPRRPDGAKTGATGGRAATLSRPRLALAVAFVSGLTSLGYQTLWTRLMSSGTGGSSYVFTSILIIFLAGIAIGAYLYSRVLHRTSNPVALLGFAELVLAAVVLASLGVSTNLFGTFGLAVGLVVVVAPATLIMGIVFPMSSMLVADSDESVGAKAGLLLGANTLGAICGTFIVPFVLIPTVTSPRAVVLLVAVNALTGLALIWQGGAVRFHLERLGKLASLAATAVAVVVLLVPNKLVADPFVNRANVPGATVLSQAEDDISSVQAVSIDGSLRLYVAGTSMSGLSVDTRLMAHLPPMYRPQARTMCVIAFGMGSSFRSSLMDGLTVDAVELVPSVPGMFGDFYSDAKQVLANPKGHIYIADGRNYVQLTKSTYDLLIVDPPPPQDSAGAGVLYSQEFYEAARSRLNKGGVMMEFEASGQPVDDMRSQVKTFKSVFKHVSLSFAPFGVLMLGSDDPLDLTVAGMQSELSKPGVVKDLSTAPEVGEGMPPSPTTADSWQQWILDSLWISDAQADEFGASGTLITDDRPYTEYDLFRVLLNKQNVTATRENLLKAAPKSIP